MTKPVEDDVLLGHLRSALGIDLSVGAGGRKRDPDD